MSDPPSETREQLRAALLAMADLPYGGEAVDQLEHSLQTATLAADADARPELVAAALLHDIGRSPRVAALMRRAPHERVAAAYCTRLLGHDVGWLVGAHVLAKRVLVRTDPTYAGLLSAVSTRSLAEQGGPAGDVELAAFQRHPLHREALMLRRWDDAAKVRGAPTRSLDELLDTTLRAFGVTLAGRTSRPIGRPGAATAQAARPPSRWRRSSAGSW